MKRTWAEKLSHIATTWTGTSTAFLLAVAAILVWILTGPIFGYSDTWQLAINTATTIITFLMVFLIQRSQNKDSMAIHLKLNELVSVIQGASNHLIDAEDMAEAEIRVLQKHFHTLVKLAKEDVDITSSHSVDEAIARHDRKTTKLGIEA